MEAWKWKQVRRYLMTALSNLRRAQEETNSAPYEGSAEVLDDLDDVKAHMKDAATYLAAARDTAYRRMKEEK